MDFQSLHKYQYLSLNVFYLYFIEMSTNKTLLPFRSGAPPTLKHRANVNPSKTMTNPNYIPGITPVPVKHGAKKTNIGGKLRRKTKKYHKKSKKRVRKCKKCRGTQKRR
tara:strand:- start:547 stop:873 length:327 start_codon:yes stop_codon:yes gene_type:complete